MDINLIIAKEVERLTLEGLSYNAALRKVKEMYKEKALNPCDQTEDKEHDKLFNSIIAPNEDIDNDQVIDRDSGEVKRDL